ncbi:glycosyltransferase family 4 protein [Gelidibacter gilvus]|uniref:Glycosyltransferase family 1 protein n=1 Tax=Gelidibacter gilvus TaxID=59602 RepID=A0A4Q0XF39_9FLAO|nr:glycosyltransferase family 4 protein [Gelidibacter gilvus]RXJ46040.1 glycosyltransferase family 1 protein [Gelidibacter gilvus]
MRLAYITNTSLNESSGGGSGVNFATYNYLKDVYEISYFLIYPCPDLKSKAGSVLLRKLYLKRNYHYFSELRLDDVRKKFETIEGDFDAYFFHGFTQWIAIKPNKPYFCFNDACFATYVDIYNNKEEFKESDLDRIYKKEAVWLKNAEKVFFRSQWALNETKKVYNMDGNNFVNVGVGGFIDIPDADTYKEGFNFLFISREFIPKGGKVVVEAFQELKKTYDDINLQIVGEDPGDAIKAVEGVYYLGFFNKADALEKKALMNVFANAFALIHPTIKDTNTLVINELAYYGCVAISSNKFAIPEYLIDGQTGYLLNDPRDSKELKSLMKKLIVNPVDYSVMRKNARKNAVQYNTWNAVGQRVIKEITNSVQA